MRHMTDVLERPRLTSLIVLRKVRVSHQQSLIIAGFQQLSLTLSTLTLEGGGAKNVGGAGLHSRAVALSQLVFVVAEFSQGHLSAELHHLPEHLLG